jgi:hypothetical protein
MEVGKASLEASSGTPWGLGIGRLDARRVFPKQEHRAVSGRFWHGAGTIFARRISYSVFSFP